MYFRSEKRIKEKMRASLLHINKKPELLYGQCGICRKEIMLINISNKSDRFCICK